MRMCKRKGQAITILWMGSGLSREREKRIRMKMPSARTTAAAVVSSRGAVAGRGLGWDVCYL